MSDFLSELFGDGRNKEYTADFLPATELLSSFNYGFCLDGRRSLTIQDSTRNAIVFGGTGNGKSAGILIPSILKMRGHSSMIINDPSGELLLKTSGALIKANYIVQVLNYSDMKGIGYNPLKRIRSSPEIKKLAKMLVRNSLGTSSEAFWNIAAEQILSLFIQLILDHFPERYHNLYNVYFLISVFAQHNPEKIDKLFINASPTLLNEYKAFAAYGDRTLASILATARAAISIFGTDKTVAQVCSNDSIDVSAFRRQKTALYIRTNIPDMRYYAPITSIFLEQIFAEIMSHLPDKKNGELPLFFLIDEASSLFFNQLQITVSNIRKFFSGILQIYQSPSQIIDLYGAPAAKAIIENCFARVYMPGQPIGVCDELERSMGKFEYLDEKNVRHVRSLLTANEIRELDTSLIFCSNKKAIKTKTAFYFKQFFKDRLTKLPPYEPKSNLSTTFPELIQLPD